jgi:hypothetical protein
VLQWREFKYLTTALENFVRQWEESDYEGESGSSEEDHKYKIGEKIINKLHLLPEDANRARGFFRQFVDKAVGATSVVVKGAKKLKKVAGKVAEAAKIAATNVAGQARDKVIEKAIQ